MIRTGSPDEAVAATMKLVSNTAAAGARCVTVIVWAAVCAAVSPATVRAPPWSTSPAWSKDTEQPPVPLVIVTVA